jgi:hypothetical protein
MPRLGRLTVQRMTNLVTRLHQAERVHLSVHHEMYSIAKLFCRGGAHCLS